MCFYKDLFIASEVVLPFIIFILCLYTNPSPTSFSLKAGIVNSSTELWENTKRRRFPDVIIAGCMKTGTSFLRTTLAMHSRIAVSRETAVNFFDRMGKRSFHWYLHQLPPVKDEELVLVKSANDYMNRRIPFYASKMNIKVIISLRNPVERTISHYLRGKRQDFKSNMPSLSLEDVTAINQKIIPNHVYIRYSTYASFLPDWLAYFELGRNLHIVDADNLIRRPWEELEKIQIFLDLEVEIDKGSFVFSRQKGFYCFTGNFTGEYVCKTTEGVGPQSNNCTRNCHNRQLTAEAEDGATCMVGMKGHDHSNVTSEAFLDRLYNFYRPHNEKLFRMLGQSFNWSKKIGNSLPK